MRWTVAYQNVTADYESSASLLILPDSSSPCEEAGTPDYSYLVLLTTVVPVVLGLFNTSDMQDMMWGEPDLAAVP